MGGSDRAGALLGASDRQASLVEQPKLDEHRRLIPIDTLELDLAALVEADHYHERDRHFAARRLDAGEEGRNVAVMGEADQHLVDELALADGARDQLDAPVVGRATK